MGNTMNAEESVGASTAPSGNEEGGPFRLVRLVGRGPSGEVHEGLVHLEDGEPRRVAVKILAEDPQDEPGRLRRLVEALADVDHPNLQMPFEYMATGDGRILISEFVDGLTLAEIIRRMRRLGRPIPPELALEITAQSLEGLICLHDAQDPAGGPMLHRNLKPSNIFIGLDGEVRLIDFLERNRLAEPENRVRGLAQVTVLPYLAPEQLGDSLKLTAATDLYCLGTVVYELLSGRPLFDGSPARRELEIRVGFGVQDKIQALDAVVPGIAQLLSRALSLNPGDRFETAIEMFQVTASLRNNIAREALGTLAQELYALPERPLTVGKPNDATTQLVNPARGNGKTGRHEARTLVRGPVTPKPPPSPRDIRLKVAVGLASLVIAFGALYWVSRPIGVDTAQRSVVTERAMKPGEPAQSASSAPSVP